MSKVKRLRPVEDYQARWDKDDDIFELMFDMFGHRSSQEPATPVTFEPPHPLEVTGPVTLEVSGRRGISRAGDYLSELLDKKLGISPSPSTEMPYPITSEPVTSKRTGPAAQKVRRARTVQDGHSMAEQQVYDTLWREARASATDEYREITIGYRALADHARLHRNTVDRNLASLQEKLAIEITKAEDRAGNIGRTYRVYGFRSVLERREAAGLVWFIKDRAGVRLLRDTDFAPHTSEVIGPITPEKTPPVPLEVTGPVTTEVTPPVTTEVTTIRKEEDSVLVTSTSAVAAVLLQELDYVDDDAVRRIIGESRRRIGDATMEEIANFTRITARRIRRMRNLQNPTGLLIVQVPKCFEGESFRNYRAAEFARKEAEKQELIRIANEILRDPTMSEHNRRWAAEIIGEQR
ncbi:MAG: hypothetical protein WB676_17145 [Bryobacteraceae bacterium]